MQLSPTPNLAVLKTVTSSDNGREDESMSDGSKKQSSHPPPFQPPTIQKQRAYRLTDLSATSQPEPTAKDLSHSHPLLFSTRNLNNNQQSKNANLLSVSQTKQRRDFTNRQNLRLRMYRQSTQFQVFFRQAMAINYFDSLLEGYSDEADLDSDGSEPIIDSVRDPPDQNPVRSEEIQQCPSSLWSMEPRVFAMETVMKGRRKYISAHIGRFMDHYWKKCDVYNRHYYELIREDTPCRLYFGKC